MSNKASIMLGGVGSIFFLSEDIVEKKYSRTLMARTPLKPWRYVREVVHSTMLKGIIGILSLFCLT